MLVNGGQIASGAVAASLGSARPVVVLAGSGRAADAITPARAGKWRRPPRGRDRGVAARAADLGDAGAVAAAIETNSRGRPRRLVAVVVPADTVSVCLTVSRATTFDYAMPL